ncbi:RDD family protein [Streptomyces sp. NPDC088762]|uniref:RDD family protein n=1 Tax=Streptomyces sp. NPDC088762 TaxID=3365891 RepID=UPI003811E99F
MTASPGDGEHAAREGYYPDPSIPGYVRYWNGAAWVPGTSRPAPPADETGPVFLDQTSATEVLPERSPEPAVWQADPLHQAGFGGPRDHRVSWGNPPEPGPAEARPAGISLARTPETRLPAQAAAGILSARSPAAQAPAPAPTAPGPGQDAYGPGSGGAGCVPGRPGRAPNALPPPLSDPAPRSAPEEVPRRAPGPAGTAPTDTAPAAPAPAPAWPEAPGAGTSGATSTWPEASAASPAPPAGAPRREPAVQPSRPEPWPPRSGASRPTAPQTRSEAPAAAPAPAPAQPAEPSRPEPREPRNGGAARPSPSGGRAADQAEAWAPRGRVGAPRPAEASPASEDSAEPSGRPAAPRPEGTTPRAVFERMAERAVRPAGLVRRAVARALDSVVHAAVAAAAAWPQIPAATAHLEAKVDAARGRGRTTTVWLLDGTIAGRLALVLGAVLLFGVLYEALPTARWGRTPGKKLLGVRVLATTTLRPPAFGAALRRWLVYALLGLPGSLWCLVDRPRRQAWHDKAAKTYVSR